MWASFSATVNLPNPILQWTNQSAGATINRGTGVEVDWTGGAPGSCVAIIGDSFGLDTEASGSFVCIAPQSALKFVVPNYVLYNLPAGSGHLSVGNDASFGDVQGERPRLWIEIWLHFHPDKQHVSVSTLANRDFIGGDSGPGRKTRPSIFYSITGNEKTGSMSTGTFFAALSAVATPAGILS